MQCHVRSTTQTPSLSGRGGPNFRVSISWKLLQFKLKYHCIKLDEYNIYKIEVHVSMFVWNLTSLIEDEIKKMTIVV